MAEYEYLRALREQKKALHRADAVVMRDMAKEFYKVQEALADRLELAVRAVADLQARGLPVNPNKLYQVKHYRALMQQMGEQFEDFYAFADTRTQLGMRTFAEMAGANTAQILNGLPDVGINFNRLPAREIQQIVLATQNGQPLAQLLDARLWTAASRPVVTSTIIRGVAMGKAPYVIAKQVQGHFAGGLQKAMLIARTEQMRVYRTVQAEGYAQSGITRYQRRMCAQGSNTCIACIATDGDLYPADEPLDDHPNGMCTGVPVVIGQEGREPPWKTADRWLAEQDEDVQRTILGPERVTAYKEGAPIKDFVKETNHPIWGRSVQIQPLKDGPGGVSSLRVDPTAPIIPKLSELAARR